MKTILKTAVIAAVILLAAGCSKENAARFKGDYTFKTSGTVTAVPQGSLEGTEPTVFELNAESGQMSLVKKDKSKNDMAVTMNILAGDAVFFENVQAEGKLLTILEPYPVRHITVKNGSLPAKAEISISGTGEKFTDVVIFNLQYKGKITCRDEVYEITGSDIDCIAQEN